jgi:hypothetical protein
LLNGFLGIGEYAFGVHGDFMRSLITLLIGGACGFAIGAWTPLSESFPLSKVEEFVVDVISNEEGDGSAEEMLSISERMRLGAEGALVYGKEAVIRLSSDQEDSSLVESDWSMALSDISQKVDPISRASLEAEAASDQSSESEIDEEGAELIAFFENLILLAEADIKHIDEALPRLEKWHPQYFLMQSFRKSDESFIAVYKSMLDSIRGDISLEKLAELQVRLDADQQAIASLTLSGNKAKRDVLMFFKIMPAKNDSERALKKMSMDLFNSYEGSFATENALAAKLGDFPVVMALSVSGGMTQGELTAWSVAIDQLGTQRMTDQAERQVLSEQILLSTPVS